MRQVTLVLVTSVLLAAGTARAVKVGEALYVKTKDAKLLQKADAKAKEVRKLQPGNQVVWGGADEKKKMFHKVTFDGKEGYTLQQNLTPNKPAMEVASSDGKAIDQEAFKSSGAATKALSEAALKYSEGNDDILALTKGIMTAEGIAQKVTSEQAVEYINKSTGGAK